MGSSLTSFLLKQGCEIAVLSPSFPAYAQAFRERCEFIEADITKPIRASLSKKYDVVLHLAAANEVESQDQYRALMVNAFGTRNMLDFAVRNSILKFLYFSTFHVYGESRGEIRETTPLRPSNDYAATHAFGEQYVQMFTKNTPLCGIIVRPTNAYGAPLFAEIDRWSLVPSCFCKELVSHGRITLQSSGNQLRNFISLDDINTAVVVLLEHFDTTEAGQLEVYNIASDITISIRGMAERTKSAYEAFFGKDASIRYLSNKPEDGGFLSVDFEKIKKLGYVPSPQQKVEEELKKIFTLLAKRKSI